jgi:hypothetical protein
MLALFDVGDNLAPFAHSERDGLPRVWPQKSACHPSVLPVPFPVSSGLKTKQVPDGFRGDEGIFQQDISVGVKRRRHGWQRSGP